MCVSSPFSFFVLTSILSAADPLAFDQCQDSERPQTQDRLSWLHGDAGEEDSTSRPQREKRSTLAARTQLSEIVSGAVNRGNSTRGRGCARPLRGKKANGIRRPGKNSGLNPSGNPSDSQLDRPSELLQIPPPPTSNTGPRLPSNPLYITTSNNNSTGVNTPGSAQGNNDRDGIYAHRHPNEDLSSNIMDDFADTFNFQQPFLAHHSTTNTGQDEQALLGDPRMAPLSQVAENIYVAPEQPLRLGEVTRGSITPLSPVPIRRATAAIPCPPRTLPMSQRGPNVIRGSSTVVDVLAQRHAKRAPYRLPPSPVPSATRSGSATVDSRASPSIEELSVTTTGGRLRRLRTNCDWPDGAHAVIALAKEQFRLSLLTVNAMWPTVSAQVQAQDQIIAARFTLGMETRWPNIDRAAIKKVVHDGSSLRNEFKTVARAIVQSNMYNIMPTGTRHVEDVKAYISDAVEALLDKETGAWMHNSKDENGITNYFAHPAIEETIIRTLFANPHAIGSRHPERFRFVLTPVLALVCCALCCALKEWEGGTFSAIAFEVINYNELYDSIANLNIRSVLEEQYHRRKLETMWARVYSRGCRVTAVGKRRNARSLSHFVEEVNSGVAAGPERHGFTDPMEAALPQDTPHSDSFYNVGGSHGLVLP